MRRTLLLAVAVIVANSCGSTANRRASMQATLTAEAMRLAERAIAQRGEVGRFAILIRADYTLSAVGLDGGGGGRDPDGEGLAFMLARNAGYEACVDVTYAPLGPAEDLTSEVDTAVLTFRDCDGSQRETRVPLSRPVRYVWSPK